jgi:hypothetical protein
VIDPLNFHFFGEIEELQKRTGCTGRGRNASFCHSERSEESLFDLSIRKETRRDSSLRSEWQRFEFFRSL